MQLEEKESTHPSQDITSSLVSTTVDNPTIQRKEKMTKYDQDNVGTAQKKRYWINKEETVMKIENDDTNKKLCI